MSEGRKSCCEGCGESLAVATPRAITNRPGLTTLSARVGEHAELLQTLKARLSLAHQQALAALTTRESGDFTIGLLDAWASVGDVLSFYQQAIANESYLGTASERLSVLELARLIGYELRPAVAASACLAFTVEEAPGASRRVAPTAGQAGIPINSTQIGVPQSIAFDRGLKVQSLPGPGQSAQVFETVEKIEARAQWNAIRPRLTRRQSIADADRELRLDGLDSGLRRGDGLLLLPEAQSGSAQTLLFCRVASLELDPARQSTRVGLSARIDAGSAPESLARTEPLPGDQALALIGSPCNCADFAAIAEAQGFLAQDMLDNLLACRAPAARVIALRCHAAIFGHNAPLYKTLPASQRFAEYAASTTSTGPLTTLSYSLASAGFAGRSTSWAEANLAAYPGEVSGSRYVYLDSVHPTITAGSWVTLVDADKARSYRVEEAVEISRTDFTLSARLTRLTLASNEGLADFHIRTTSVFGESGILNLARQPIEDVLGSDAIELEGLVDGLKPGQKLALAGELATERGVTASEIAEIDTAQHDLSDALHREVFTRITLKKSLARSYVRSTVSLNANVALATHGETVANFGAAGETLGSADARVPFQSFTLAQTPLTRVSAATGSGALSTLEVRVQGLLWQEVDSFLDRGAQERIYLTRSDEDGTTRVIFGDGFNGARPPSGVANVSANYRKGAGSAGRVAANQLTQLLSRPLGLKSVTNPLAADGGADAQTLASARRNATLGILTLGRIVSLQDYEDFASAFAGIGKASAQPHPALGLRAVFVTVAGADGAALDENGPLMSRLGEAMLAAADPQIPLTIRVCARRSFRVSARIATDPLLRREGVIAAVERALRGAFSFDARQFGQPVRASEVLAAIQKVPGVIACALDELFLVPGGGAAQITEEVGAQVHDTLPAAAPTLRADSSVAPAELLLLDAARPTFGVL
ncbi:putative baseplate assembly protein [Niveibacterium terrae]|uniref:putative baseplate assembly protein n=1 Tax=Niveibacterium terrae TaxID=3373598 RepID=UPI003A95718E